MAIGTAVDGRHEAEEETKQTCRGDWRVGAEQRREGKSWWVAGHRRL